VPNHSPESPIPNGAIATAILGLDADAALAGRANRREEREVIPGTALLSTMACVASAAQDEGIVSAGTAGRRRGSNGQLTTGSGTPSNKLHLEAKHVRRVSRSNLRRTVVIACSTPP
jgi:hypothetical protein